MGLLPVTGAGGICGTTGAGGICGTTRGNTAGRGGGRASPPSSGTGDNTVGSGGGMHPIGGAAAGFPSTPPREILK